MGWLSALLGDTNPISVFAAANKNALAGLAGGLASGQNISDGLANGVKGAIAGQPADDAYATAQKDNQARLDAINQTEQFLHAKGFDDLVPLVKAGQGGPALTEAFKRMAPQAPIKASAGDVFLDPTTMQPEATIPEAHASGTTPSGYRWTADGNTLEPIPGGPADPASAQSISPEALDLIATQYLAGDKSAISGYARNANMRAQIANAVAAKADAAGMDGKAVAAEISSYGGNVAAQRAAGSRAAQVGMAASEANQMADIALKASSAVPRTSLVPWNAAVNAVATNTSSPEMAAFVTATTSLVNAYARAVSPLGAPTDAMRQHAEQMLNTAQGPEAYAAVIAQMKKEMEAALNAPAEISSSLKTSITGTPSGGGATTTYTYNPATGQLE